MVYAGNTCVTDVDYITVNGIKRKRITIDDHRNRIIYFVEGIGLNFEFWMDPSFAYPDNEQRYMVECYDNGLLIFHSQTLLVQIQSTQFRQMILLIMQSIL